MTIYGGSVTHIRKNMTSGSEGEVLGFDEQATTALNPVRSPCILPTD